MLGQVTLAANANRDGLGLGRRYSADVRAIEGPRGRQADAHAIRAGFAGPNDTLGRPSFDYVKSGDVIRVGLFLDAVFSAPPIASFRGALGNNANLRLVRIDQSQLGSGITGYAGTLVVDVQALNDFNKLDDVVRLVAGIAQGAGLSVLMGSTRGEFISKVESTGGNVTPSITPPGSAGGTVSDIGESISGFVGGLAQSPVTLAVILGAAVILVIAAKK